MFSALRSSAFRRHSALFRTCRGPISGRWVHQDGSTLKSGFKARRDSWLNPTIFVLGFIPIFTFALGTWQLQRLQWKINLIDELKEKLEREPITLPRLVKWDRISLRFYYILTPTKSLSVIPDFIFRKVLLKGRWDHEHTMLIGPRVREGSHGYHVVTPLMRPDGSTVLVDRGFISKDKVDKAGHLLENEEVQILGMLRTAQARNSFTPNNLPDEGIWYWTDVDAMAEYAGGEAARVQPVFIEQIFGESISYSPKNRTTNRPALRL